MRYTLLNEIGLELSPPPPGIGNGGADITAASQGRITIFDVLEEFICKERMSSGTAIKIQLPSVQSVPIFFRLLCDALCTLVSSVS